MNDEVLLILGMMLVTFGVRYPILALVGKVRLPDWVMRAMRYVPPAVLSAIIVPALVLNADNELALRPDNAYLVAGILTFVVAWRSKNILITIVAGMTALWILKAILGQF